jgi:hypothetical protein
LFTKPKQYVIEIIYRRGKFVAHFKVNNFFVGGGSCGRKGCVREIYVSHAGDPVHAGDKALTRETPVQRGRVNRYVASKLGHGD